MAHSDHPYEGHKVMLLPGRFDGGSKRIIKLGLTRNRDGEPVLVKSDVSAPTSIGRVGCSTKWLKMQPMSEDIYWQKIEEVA